VRGEGDTLLELAGARATVRRADREADDLPRTAHPTAVALWKLLASTRVRAAAVFALVAACLAGAYALGAWTPFWYQSSPGGASALWPPAGLTVAALLLTPRRMWPVWLVAFGAAEFSVDIVHHEGVALALGCALANTAEPLVGALLIRRFHWGDGYRPRQAKFVAFAVVVAPVVGAVIGGTASVLFVTHPPRWWEVMGTWWLGDAIGVLVLGTAILAWARPTPSLERAPAAVIVGVATLAGGAIVATAVVWRAPVILAALPALVWAAFAGGPRAVAAVGVAVAAATDWAALTGRTGGLLAPSSPPHDLAVLQAFLGLTLLTSIVLTGEVAERRRSEERRMRSERTAIQVAEAERHSLSQDTHDIVGHGLTAMLLQLGAARQILARDPEQAHELLVSAEAVGRRACQDLEIALASLGTQPVGTPGRGLAALPALIDTLSKAGLRVTLDNDAEGTALPTLVDWSAYRIAQEALTNVARHAPDATTTVRVRAIDNEILLCVVDDGGATTTANARKDGHGIIGMRERAAALGGTLDAGPRSGGGFAVVARLPW
jgi:signal transduction histidine kinase